MVKPEELVHSTVVAEGVVTAKNMVKFTNGQKVGGEDTFRAAAFGKYEPGTMVECHFRVAGTKRALLFANPILAGGTKEIHTEESGAPLLEEIPERIDTHYINQRTRIAFGAVKRLIDEGGIVNVLARGPSGYGKTSSFQALAKHLGMTFLRVDCSTTLDPEMWFGYQEARDGDTIFIPSPFTKAITEGNAIVVLDEANRIEPWIANSLFPILDDARATTVHGMEVKVAPKTVFALTINEGVIYAGTHQMDAAFKNRIDLFLMFEAMEFKEEIKLLIERMRIHYDIAERIVNVARQLREVVRREEIDVDVSTRTTLKVARLSTTGMTLSEAFEYVVVASAPVEDSKPIIDTLRAMFS